MTIWKYELSLTPKQSIPMPTGAQIISVAEHNNCLCLWVIVDTTKRRMKREIELVMTGNLIPERNHRFIGTVVRRPFVWHIFEIL